MGGANLLFGIDSYQDRTQQTSAIAIQNCMKKSIYFLLLFLTSYFYFKICFFRYWKTICRILLPYLFKNCESRYCVFFKDDLKSLLLCLFLFLSWKKILLYLFLDKFPIFFVWSENSKWTHDINNIWPGLVLCLDKNLLIDFQVIITSNT